MPMLPNEAPTDIQAFKQWEVLALVTFALSPFDVNIDLDVIVQQRGERLTAIGDQWMTQVCRGRERRSAVTVLF